MLTPSLMSSTACFMAVKNDMKIGNTEIPNKVFLAPMAGVTDLPFRVMCKKFGAGMVYSEMVSSKAMHYNDQKTMELLKTCPDESPLAVQIFGHEPDIMAESVPKALSTGGKVLDINMGCPAPKVANNGDGSSLLKDPKLIGKIVRAVKDVSPVPVTCKIRSGFDTVADVEYIAKTIEDNGADAICVHPRTRQMYYSGNADWSIIAKVKESVSIPVIGNGDVKNASDALRMIDRTGCDALMIGRGARGNPFIFREILSAIEGKELAVPSVCERMDTLMLQIKNAVELKGEYIGVREARKHIAWYIKNLKDSAAMRSKVCTIESLDELMKELNNYKEFLLNE